MSSVFAQYVKVFLSNLPPVTCGLKFLWILLARPITWPDLKPIVNLFFLIGFIRYRHFKSHHFYILNNIWILRLFINLQDQSQLCLASLNVFLFIIRKPFPRQILCHNPLFRWLRNIFPSLCIPVHCSSLRSWLRLINWIEFYEIALASATFLDNTWWNAFFELFYGELYFRWFSQTLFGQKSWRASIYLLSTFYVSKKSLWNIISML